MNFDSETREEIRMYIIKLFPSWKMYRYHELLNRQSKRFLIVCLPFFTFTVARVIYEISTSTSYNPWIVFGLSFIALWIGLSLVTDKHEKELTELEKINPELWNSEIDRLEATEEDHRILLDFLRSLRPPCTENDQYRLLERAFKSPSLSQLTVIRELHRAIPK